MWLIRDSDVLAAVDVARDRRSRRRGLVGRDDFAGALLLSPCRQVHTFGVRFPIDVAFCDAEGEVIALRTLGPRRLSPVVRRAAFVVEARTGAFERWNLKVGDRLELRG